MVGLNTLGESSHPTSKKRQEATRASAKRTQYTLDTAAILHRSALSRTIRCGRERHLLTEFFRFSDSLGTMTTNATGIGRFQSSMEGWSMAEIFVSG